MTKITHTDKKVKKPVYLFPALLLSILLDVIILEILKPFISTLIYKNYSSPSPIVTSNWTNNTTTEVKGDIYVSKNGSDYNSGEKNSPFKTIEKAMQEVSRLDKDHKDNIIVCIESGEYFINSLKFMDQNGGTDNCKVIYCSYGGEVVLNAGIALNSKDLVLANNYPEIANRLQSNSKNKIYVLDLKKKNHII